MKRDIKINYGVLKEVVESVKRFQTALEQVKAANERFEAGLGDYESKAVTNLRNQYQKLLKEMKSCEEELTDIHKIFSDYIADMTVHIKPVSEHEIMRVDRNDIYWNMADINGAVTTLLMKAYEQRWSDRVPWYRDEDKRERVRREMEERYDTVQSFRNNRMIPEVAKMQEHMTAISKIHHNKVIPYENEDDSYKNKASKLYSKYTNMLEAFVDNLVNAFKNVWDQCAGLLKAVWDFVAGIATLLIGVIAVLGAGIVWCVTAPFDATPPLANDILKKTGDTIGLLLYDPVLIIEGICQSASDTVEEKGIAYASGYVAGDILISIFISKGLDKFKAARAAGLSDDVARVADDVAKAADDVANLADDALQAVDDITSISDDAVQAVDDITSIADDMGGIADDAVQAADDVVGIADDAVQTMDDVAQSVVDDIIDGTGDARTLNTLTDAQKSRLNSLENTINDHLTEGDFSGTLRDLQGNPVPNGKGGFFDHMGEMKDSYKSLLKIKEDSKVH